MKTKNLLIAGIFLIGFLTIVTAQTNGYNCPMGGYGGMMGGAYGYGGTIFGWLFSALVIVALVLLIIWLVKQIQKPNNRR